MAARRSRASAVSGRELRGHVMERIQKLFLLLTLIGPLHMAEQMLTGIEEFYGIRSQLETYYGWFDPAAADLATVILITIVWTTVSLLMFALLRGGAPRLFVLGIFGVFGAQEGHHIVEAFMKGGYDPGVVTCVPYLIAGNLLVTAAWREFKHLRSSLTSTGRLVASPRAEGSFV